MSRQTFLQQLKQWGPERDSATPPCSLIEAQHYTRQLALGHYENFPIVSWLIPADQRQAYFDVYAYCRWADDLGDELDDPARSLELLAWWRSQLEDCWQGIARHPVFVALTHSARQHALSIQPFRDLLAAFVQDQSVHAYDSYEQLLAYCRHSADPVGRIVLQLARVDHPRALACSDSICTGLQLANFWQDVWRDLQIGRVYLPAEDLARFGVSRQDLERRQTTPAIRELLRFQVARTRELFAQGRPLLDHLRGRTRLTIDLFRRGGECVLDRIAAIDYRVLEQRPQVTKPDVLKLLSRALAAQVFRAGWPTRTVSSESA